MSAALAARSTLGTALTRYSRSWGLWLMLLIAPIGARLFVPRGDGTTIVISIADQLPVMTSPVIGVCLGIVVSTLLLPAAYIYLRANTNRRQPWQIAEVTPASRVAVSFGRFAADVAVLFGALAALNAAGIFLATLILPWRAFDPLALSFALWVIAGPAVIGLAAIRTLFDAVPLLRGALGDLAYLVLWIASLAAPSGTAISKSGFAANMLDFGGFVRPLIYGSGLTEPNFAIGGAEVKPGRIAIDAMAGLLSPGYLPSRLAWIGIALAVVVVAALIYRPHRARNRPSLAGRAGKLLEARRAPAADPRTPAAPRSTLPALTLFAAEFRLIGAGRLFKLLAVMIGLAGVFTDAMPLLLLLLVFALTAHAGRSESAGLAALTRALPTGPWQRRCAFVLAGSAWAALIALPHALVQLDPAILGTAAALAGLAAAAAAGLAAVSGSSFAPRLVLLIAWYGYTAS
jgi:hypothetical protein